MIGQCETDQAASLSIDGLEELVKSIKKVKKILGDGKKGLQKKKRKDEIIKILVRIFLVKM